MARIRSEAARHVGEVIRRTRKEREYGPDDLAVRCGIDSTNIRSYEAGRAMPNVYSLVRIATALDVSPGSLIEGLTLELFEPSPRNDRRS
ncbi:MAG: helix-turn-helix transcriptional regulator [Microbacteriaceae bacterium]|nr:helix-turn-helix transcriptional regulator [Microbacteriaceae bacterium]